MNKTKTSNAVGIVLVTYGNEATLPELLKRLVKEKTKDDQIVLIDNHVEHGCAQIAESTRGVDTVIRGDNIGFAAACNEAVRALTSQVDTILFLNPDVLPEAWAITELRNGAKQEWSAWMGLLKLPDGTINSAGNVVHISGLSWCDQYSSKVKVNKTQEVTVLSGACLMIRREAWESVGGFNEDYFLYYEDTDLSFAMLKQGLQLGLVPTAHFEHDYVYDKSPQKWFYLERNRYIFILRQWPLAVIVVMTPLLIMVELGLWIISILQRRFVIRVRAVVSFIWLMPRVLSERWRADRAVITSRQFMEHLQPTINTPLLGFVGKSRLLNKTFSLYYRAACWLIGAVC